VCREAEHRQIKVLHAVIEMVEAVMKQLNHRNRLAGEGSKPPKGAVVKSHGTERLGKAYPRDVQVRI